MQAEERVAAFIQDSWTGVSVHHAFCRNPLHPGPCAQLGRLKRKKTRNPAKLTGTFRRYLVKPNWWDQIPDDTGPDGIPVEDLTFAIGGGDTYTVASGTVWKADGVVYMAEHGSGRRPRERAREAMGRIYEAHQAEIAPEDFGAQQAYALLERWRPSNLPTGQQVQANARNGSTTIYGFYEAGLPANLEALLRHEYAHNAGFVAARVDESPRWYEAGAKDAARGRTGGEFTRVRITHPEYAGKVTAAPDPSKEYPNGVTPYGQSRDAEDFAESVSMYLAGPIGEAVLTARPDLGHVPIYFRDLFPARAEILDDLYPRVAARQQRESREQRTR